MIVSIAKLYATFAHWACRHRRKYTGEPYIVHPQEVYETLRRYTNDKYLLAAAWLHDVYEDCGWLGKLMFHIFPARIVDLVLQVSMVSKPEMGNRKFRKAIDLNHYAMADSEGQTLKLADVKANTKRLAKDDPEFAVVYLNEKAALLPYLMRGHSILWNRVAKQLMRGARDLGMDTSHWDTRILSTVGDA
jgi:(p)ppGpp synthase/HD superfamily hydrolase